MYFYILAIVLGLFGAISDICVNYWIEKDRFIWWAISAVLFVIFMTGLGFCIRLGTYKGYSFSIIVVNIVIMNILGVVAWDYFQGVPLNGTKILGILFAIAAIICLEIK